MKGLNNVLNVVVAAVVGICLFTAAPPLACITLGVLLIIKGRHK